MPNALPSAQRPVAPGVSCPSPAATNPRDAAAAATPLVTGQAAAPSKALTLREVNAARIAFVVNRIDLFFKGGCRGDPSILLQACYTLARGIDFSVTADEVYANAHDLPPLIKQVYKYRNEASLQPAIMVLLISVKNACRKSWFQEAERDELLAMANEVSRSFCFGSAMTEKNKVLSIISKLMPRFFPQMKLGDMLVSLEAKPGYDILVADFIVPKDSLKGKVRLFVSQTDNMETSSCLISPPSVNFLINGRGVERRICGSADVGPQFPTDITKILKYGSNLIQAIGFFGGNYVIAVALTNTITSSGIPVLQDYVQPVVATVAQDAEIIEGPSKISLSCPISFRRIKTPVKGYHCKHHQCFDYENFMAMNARKPSWRCPHCNQSVRCVDIRIDQNMAKILAETREYVSHVVISADGSWKVIEHTDNGGKLQNGKLTSDKNSSIGCEPNGPSNTSSGVVVDLTVEEHVQADDAISPRQTDSNCLLNHSRNVNICDTEERKPFQDILQGFSAAEFISAAQPVNFTSEATQVTCDQGREELWSGVSLAMPMSVVSGNVSRPYSRTLGAGLLTQSTFLNPVITDAVSPALSRGEADIHPLATTAFLQSSVQAQQFMDNLQLQQRHFGNSIVANETERHPIPRHVNRTPIAIQALPAQTQNPSYHQRPQTTAFSSSSVPSPSMLVIPDEINARNTGAGRQQILERQQMTRVLTEAQLHSAIQNPDLQNSLLNQASLSVMGLPAQNPVSLRPLPNLQRGSGSFSMQPHIGGQSPQQLYHNLWAQQRMSHATSIATRPFRLSSVPVHHATEGAVNMVAGSLVNHNQVVAAQQLAQPTRLQVTMQASRMPVSLPTTSNSFGPSGGEQVLNAGDGMPETHRSNGFGETTSEQNWRPSGRMRGSLIGSAYSAALSHYTSQPSQSASTMSASVEQNRTATSEHILPPVFYNMNASGSPAEQPSVRSEDSGGPLQV